MNQKYILYLILIIDNFVGLFITIRFYNNTLIKKPISKIRKLCSLFLVLILAIVLNYLAEYIGNLIVSGVIIYFIVGHLYYEGKISIKAIISVFILIFSIATELLTGTLATFVFKQQLLQIRSNLLFLILGSIISKIMLLMLVEFIIRFRNRNISYVSLGSWFLILSIPVISIFLSINSVYEPILNNESSLIPIITCLSILYINLITFYLFDNIVSKVFENNQYKFKEKQMLMQQEQYQNILSGYDQVKKVRHDMMNHLILLDSYLAKEQYDQALNYIGKLSTELDISKKGVISSNIIVDALINNCMEKAKRLAIDITYEILIPNHLNIDDMDLCIVLGNVLDNAIEACERITDHHTVKKIDFKMKFTNGYVCIDEKNTYNEDTVKQINGKFLSSKGYREGNSIGIGLGNIQSIIDKYGGAFYVESQDHIFNLKIIVPDKKM